MSKVDIERSEVELRFGHFRASAADRRSDVKTPP